MEVFQTKWKSFKQYEPIQIKEPYNKNTINFENTDDFTVYYREHEDDFKNISTQLLNRTYKIPGYRIRLTGSDKKLILVKDYGRTDDLQQDDLQKDKCLDLQQQIHTLQEQVRNIEQFLQQLK